MNKHEEFIRMILTRVHWCISGIIEDAEFLEYTKDPTFIQWLDNIIEIANEIKYGKCNSNT